MKKMIIVIFLLITVSSNTICMEQETSCNNSINLKDPALLGEHIETMLAMEASGRFVPQLLSAEHLCKGLLKNHSMQTMETAYDKKTLEHMRLLSQRSKTRKEFFIKNKNQDNVHLLEDMITKNPFILNSYNIEQNSNVEQKSLLHKLVHLEQRQCTQKLLQLKANPNCIDSDYCTPLHIGIESRVCISIIEDLLAAGANPEQRDCEGKTPFDRACSKHSSVTQAFEPYGYLFFSSLWPYQNPYELLKHNGKYLKELASGPLGSSEWELAEAALNKLFNHIDQNKSVCTSKSKVFINEYGCVLHNASQKDCEEFFGKETLDYARKTIQEIDTVITYLFSLIEEDNNTHLEEFLEKNTLSSPLAYEILISCIENNAMACLKVCLNHHFNPNRYHREISLLHYAVESDNHDAITLLAKHNADLLILNANKQTPLTMAITLKRQNCIAALTKAIKKRCKKLLSIKNSNYSCGLTKHIFNDNTPLKFCKDCVETLMWQLDYHNLS